MISIVSGCASVKHRRAVMFKSQLPVAIVIHDMLKMVEKPTERILRHLGHLLTARHPYHVVVP